MIYDAPKRQSKTHGSKTNAEQCRANWLVGSQKIYQPKQPNQLPTITMTSAITKPTVGSMRQIADLRQIGALMIITGMCAIFFTVILMSNLISPDGATVSTGYALASLIGAVCEFTIGVVSVFIGYNQLVHDKGNKNLTLFAALFTQTAFIPYIADMYDIGRQAKDGAGFINPVLNPTATDVRFVGAMGIIAILVIGITLIGSISFQHFTLYAYQTNKQNTRGALYFKGRLSFYSILLFIAGFTQLALGAYVRSHFGSERLAAPVAVAVYVVSYPGIAIFLGIVQVLCGVWGMLRSHNIGRFTSMDFQGAMFMAWLLQVVLQAVVQIGILPGPTFSFAAAQVTTVTFGLNLMPAYLDYKAQTLPEDVTEYYGSGTYSTDDGSSIDVVMNNVVIEEAVEQEEEA